jgi:hypothetical protein
MSYPFTVAGNGFSPPGVRFSAFGRNGRQKDFSGFTNACTLQILR